MLVLREKDLGAEAYGVLAQKVMAICEGTGTQCVLHSFTDVALALKSTAIHLPLHLARQQSISWKQFTTRGVSVHSVKEAVEAQKLGATYLTAGHVFFTDCKKGVAPRGLSFLNEVVQGVSIPVYGIGGVSLDNITNIKATGAAGACIMSQAMTMSAKMMDLYKKAL